MITIVAVIKTVEGKDVEVEAAFLEMIEKIKSEEGTTTYVLHRSSVEPRTFMFYEQYKDDDAFNAHMTSSYMADMSKKIGDLLEGSPSIEMYEEIARK